MVVAAVCIPRSWTAVERGGFLQPHLPYSFRVTPSSSTSFWRRFRPWQSSPSPAVRKKWSLFLQPRQVGRDGLWIWGAQQLSGRLGGIVVLPLTVFNKTKMGNPKVLDLCKCLIHCPWKFQHGQYQPGEGTRISKHPPWTPYTVADGAEQQQDIVSAAFSFSDQKLLTNQPSSRNCSCLKIR